MVTREQILAALRTVIDPELHHNIVDLGLIYRAEVKEGGRIEIDLTLTTPACPLAPYIVAKINEALVKVQGVEDVAVNLVFDPPWTIEKIDPNLRFDLFPNYIPPSTPSDSLGGY